MSENYYQAKKDGTCEVGEDPKGPNKNRIKEILKAALFSHGWTIEPDEFKNNPYETRLKNTGLNIDLYIYCWRIGKGSRSNMNYEKRIQIGACDRKYLAKDNNANTRVLLLGLYELEDDKGFPVFVAWEAQKEKNAGNSKSCFIDARTIAKAMRDGFAQMYNGNNDLICAFRQEFLHFYIMNIEKMHNIEFANNTNFDNSTCNNNESDSSLFQSNENTTDEVTIQNNSNNSNIPYNNFNNHNISKNTILYGPPGTGKTYNLAKYAVRIIEDKTEDEIENEKYQDVIERYNKYIVDGQVFFITFHQSYSYEEFIEGIRPVINDKDNKSDIKYEIKSGIFKQMVNSALNDKGKNYVFVIDEINRGNISKIFGELITLIEDSKRLGNSEALSVMLPYSNEKFGVPKNLYILGTMNTADRSIALLDSALRRRFDFIEIAPSVEALKNANGGQDLKVIDKEEINICSLLDIINKRIEILYDKDHMIGHAYFIKLVANPNIETLASIFKKKIIPLLEEYFYNDYEKIMLVLGDNQTNSEEIRFIKKLEVNSNLFGEDGEVDNNYIYSLNNEAFKVTNSFIKIYSGIKKNSDDEN